MRTFLAVALVLTMGMGLLFFWVAVHPRSLEASSSQIFIHGTPVCVTQRGGEIQATVGACSAFHGGLQHGDQDGYRGSVPVPGNPRLELPPGHPPIGPDDGPITDPNRRTLI